MCFREDDDEPSEVLKPQHMFNPWLQRLYQVKTNKNTPHW